MENASILKNRVLVGKPDFDTLENWHEGFTSSLISTIELVLTPKKNRLTCTRSRVDLGAILRLDAYSTAPFVFSGERGSARARGLCAAFAVPATAHRLVQHEAIDVAGVLDVFPLLQPSLCVTPFPPPPQRPAGKESGHRMGKGLGESGG